MNIVGVFRQFNPARFKEFGNWLEYSIEEQVVFCLCCYLFMLDIGKQACGDSFEHGVKKKC
jgi:hypothetical protein